MALLDAIRNLFRREPQGQRRPTALLRDPRAIAIAAAVAVAVPVTAGFEGLRTKPYRDPVGIPTVCYGETERAMRTYTADECAVMLKARQAADYAPKVLDCVPGFVDDRHRHAFAAAIDASYNAGSAAFCRSRMARSFNLGRWADGCNGFVGWYETGAGKRLPGLTRRRAAERTLCLKDMG